MSRKAFLLRIDVKLWEDLMKWSQDDLRSVNGQIEYLLRQAVDKRKGVRGGKKISPDQQVPTPEDGGGFGAGVLL